VFKSVCWLADWLADCAILITMADLPVLYLQEKVLIAQIVRRTVVVSMKVCMNEYMLKGK
jgi:hypothetical protein